MPETFFLVWSPTGPTPPKHRHSTRETAKAEAERLARLNRGAEFFVLVATDRLVVDDVKHDELVDSIVIPMPF